MITIIKKINVTKTSIKRGVCGEPYSCPIARAIKCSGVKNPCVSHAYLEGTYANKEFKVNTPLEISRWIRRYDRNKKVEPFTFNLKFKV